MGRTKIPTARLKVVGSERSLRRRKAESEPQPKKAPPKRPPFVTGAAIKIWNRVVPLLDSMGVLTVVDGEQLGRYCVNFARWEKLKKLLEKEGETFTTDKGYIMQRPEVSIVKNLDASLARTERQFGMTPAARPGLATVQPERESKLAQLLKKRGGG